MMIHELATNAVKYDALSLLGGAFSVEWMQGDGHIEMHWRERNVPIMQKPERNGLGTRLFKDILPRQIGARINLDYQSDGLNARLIIPV
jgi:two-component sensor histidine kinase